MKKTGDYHLTSPFFYKRNSDLKIELLREKECRGSDLNARVPTQQGLSIRRHAEVFSALSSSTPKPCPLDQARVPLQTCGPLIPFMMKNVCEDHQWSHNRTHMEQLFPMFRVALGAVFPGDEGMDMLLGPFLNIMRFVFRNGPTARHAHGRELRVFLHQMGFNRFLCHLSSYTILTASG